MRQLRVIGYAAVCATMLATACAKKAPQAARVDPPPPVSVVPPVPPGPEAPPEPPPPAVPSEEELFARKTLDELNAERPLGDALFALDASSIRDDARAVLQKNAEWLQRWPSTRITIEGHCDERGTAEYNLALGDRRAAAVRSYLVSLGIAPDRMLVVSKGKEAPVCTDATESCWQQNRRGHPVITAK